MRIARSLVILGLFVTAFGRQAAVSAGDDPKPVIPEDPVYLFLNAPNDLDTFWKLIGRPDKVVLDGEAYRKIRKAAEGQKPLEARPSAVIEAVRATGRIVGDWAHLVLEFRITLEADAPEWVPIRLDGLTLSEAREKEQDLPTRIVVDRGWQVELQGPGEHRVKVALIAPVRSTVEGKRLDLAIPAVASTAIDLVVPQAVIDASSGINEKLAVVPLEGKTVGTRLEARLSPRPRLELAWREQADPAVKLPPLLEASGDVALEVDRDSIVTRSTWGITSIRGTVGQIRVRLDPVEEVLEVLVEGRQVLVETGREGSRSVVAIPLSEPLRPGTSRAVTLNTRRSIASVGSVRAVIDGYSFDQAKVLRGSIAVSRSGPLFLNPNTSRGLRRIDPRTELPESLRNKADTVLAFEFNGPSFELGLTIEQAPPRLQVDERTTIVIDPRSARIQTRLDCRTSQGRIYEVLVHVPRGLEFEGAEPASVIGSTDLIPYDPKGGTLGVGVGVDVPRLLSIRLKPQAAEDDAFGLTIKGWCAIDPSRPIALPLFQPVLDSSHGSRFAIVTDRNVAVELPPTTDDQNPFRVDWSQPPTDWEWPRRKPTLEQGLLWLRSDANPETLPLRATIRPRAIRHESTLTATIDRNGADVVEEITGEVAFGPLSRLDLAIPKDIGDRWEIEGLERSASEPLAPEADGTRRYRVRFPRDDSDKFRLRIRYRLPFHRATSGERESRLTLTPIRVLEGTSTGRRIVIAAEAGFDVKGQGNGWTVADLPDPTGPTESGTPSRLILYRATEGTGPVTVLVRSGPVLSLPPVVVSRLWIKTTQRLDNALSTSAYFWVEARDRSMGIGLEPGSAWVQVRVGSTVLGEGSVEQVNPDEYRLVFPPATPTGPILVAIDYTTPASALAKGWPAPKLLAGGVIQQTIWEAQLLGTRAGLGTPPGWLDENEWYWDGLIWRRRPWKSPLELASWLTGGSTRYRLAESMELGDRANRNSYVFSKVGPPSSLRISVVSRFTLLLLCSGPVLAVGLTVLARRPPPRLIAASGLIIAFAAGALIEPDVLFLTLQSSALGVVLFLTALVIHWTIELRNPRRIGGEVGTIAASSTVGSTFERAPGVGSDDSTAIRTRPVTPAAVSTADHIVLTRNLGRPPDQRSTSELDLR